MEAGSIRQTPPACTQQSGDSGDGGGGRVAVYYGDVGFDSRHPVRAYRRRSGRVRSISEQTPRFRRLTWTRGSQRH
jgi:hypothetical protein